MNEAPTLLQALPLGTFTVVRLKDQRRITIRIREAFFPASGPKIVAEYLKGPDNEADYRGFAFVDPVKGTYTLWKRVIGSAQGEAWFRWALDVLKGDPIAAGKAWSAESKLCWRCNRRLTTPESIVLGLGPDCARMVMR